MTCREFVDFLMSYLDGELDEEVRRVFEAHVSGCPACLSYMHGYEKAVDLGRCACKDEDGPVPADAPPELIEAILVARRAN